ncbi:hypothetical protein AU468_10100 [Alkalispirochaeta sphaeroplastigenens]|uniref:HTH araC/xylS-type domain-containing protein n=2 Tax=Alkalispirochaeta sphaeroplastigenens TaxID=1187066 RepID=A0A2S4JJE0_9SPIO|nr:hypothetical protein AU468_10100 [Alkalispirochaeta sphaeroplastigenens]
MFFPSPPGSAHATDLKDLIVQEELLAIFTHIARAFGFRTSLLDLEGREILPGEAHQLSRYCRLVQESLHLRHRCRENDRCQASIARQRGTAHHYTCHAGLAEAIFPLLADQHCVGYILVGQFRHDRTIPPDLHCPCGSLSPGALREAYQELPRCTTDQLQSILELLRITTSYILDHRIVTARRTRLADAIRETIRSSCDTPLTMSDLATRYGRSPSTINQALREVTGKSFSSLLAETRLERARRLLQEEPETPIQEIARRVGFDDPLYFSRFFRTHQGVSPRTYRQNLDRPLPSPGRGDEEHRGREK